MLHSSRSPRTSSLIVIIIMIAASIVLSDASGPSASAAANGRGNVRLRPSVFGEWMPKMPWLMPTARPLGPLAGTVSLTSFTTAYTQNFDTLASSGDTNTTVPTGWAFSESGTSANTEYRARSGTANTGDTYSWGQTGSTDRAFGGLQSGALIPTVGASFTNDTGAVMASLTITYTGEQWRLGDGPRPADQLDFQYSTDATSLTTGTWTNYDALDFSAPIYNTSPAASLDGNAAANRTAISSTITGLNIANGGTIWIRWTDFNVTNADDGLGVDDFSAKPNPLNTVQLSVDTTSASEAAQTVVTATATAASPVVGNQTVNIAVTGTNITAGDYSLSSPTITILNGATTGSVTFTIKDDTVYEGDESAALTIGSPSGGITLGAVTSQTVTIADNEPVPSLSLQAASAPESAGTMTFTVQRTGASELASTFHYATSDGTAFAGADYTAASGTGTIIAGAASTTVPVAITQDTVTEPDETFDLTIDTPVNATIADGVKTGTIIDDETYYVDNTNAACSDTNSGITPQLPFCTISRGAALATAGKTVRVLHGTYAETVYPNSGAAGQPVTFRADPNVTVTGNAAGFGSAFAMGAKSYIVIDGFNIDSTKYKGIYADASDHLTIINNRVSRSGVTSPTHPYEQGIYLRGTTYSEISGNTTDHNTCIGIRLVLNSDHNVVSNNVSFSNFSVVETDAAGIELTGSSYNTVIHNIVYSNEDSGINVYYHDLGVASSYNLIVGNLTYENGDHGIDTNNSPYNTVIGNTAHGNGTVGINFEGEPATGSHHAVIRNNITANNGYTPPTGSFGGNLRVDAASVDGTVSDHNVFNIGNASVQIIWNNVNYLTLAAMQAAVPGQETNGREGDPLFVDPVPPVLRQTGVPYEGTSAVGDYHLLSGSPATDSADSDATGETVLDLDGKPRIDDPLTVNTGVGVRSFDDRGAYEYRRPPAIEKAFGASEIDLGATTTLTITVTNPHPADALTGVGFTDTMPDGLTVADQTSLQCGGTLTAASNVVTLADAAIPGGGSCIIGLTVTGATAGVKNNVTGRVTSANFGSGNTASATVAVYDNRPHAAFTAVPNPAACNQTIAFDATASTHGHPGRAITSYSWDFGDGQTGSGATPTHAYSSYGFRTATLTVTDNNTPPRTDTVSHDLMISLGNAAPIPLPGGPYVGGVEAPVTLDGRSSYDPNASCGDQIVRYEWLLNSTILFGEGPMFAPDLSALASGMTHTIMLRVTDSFGAAGTATTTLYIPPPPTAGTYSDTAITLSGNINISPSMPLQNATRATVSTNSRFNGTLTVDPATGVVRISNARPAGTYQFTIKASGMSGSITRTFMLTVDNGTVCGGQAQFSNAPNVSVGSAPHSVAAADFNGDGRQDLAVANTSTGAVSIRLGDGSGGFTGTTNISAGGGAIFVTTADVNNDGRLDLLIANYLANTVSIRLGDGAGGFSGSTDLPVGNGPFAVAAGDLNGDGNRDLATANRYENKVAVSFGDGTGNFAGTVKYNVGDSPTDVVIGDLNGDGNNDLAIANGGSGSITIKPGDGLGGFGAAAAVSVGNNPSSLAIGDFNVDGKPDMAVTTGGPDNKVQIRLGDGLGGFSGTVSFSSPINPQHAAIGDFNSDGKQDLAISHNSDRPATIRFGDGTGGFPTEISVDAGGLAISSAIGDFNADGRQDIAFADYGSSVVTVRMGGCKPLVEISAAPLTGYESAGTAIVITATATDKVVGDQTVEISVSGTGITADDLTLSSSTITIPDQQKFGTATFYVADDPDVEGTETAVLTLNSPSSGIGLGTTVTQNITIIDNDTAGVVINESGNSTNVAEGGATDTYSIVLSSRPASDVTITVNPAYSVGQTAVDPSSLTFTRANYASPQTVTVTAVDDTAVEGPHTGAILHSAASADANYDGIAIASVTAHITDNDDVLGPVITYTPIANTASTDPIALAVNATDNIAVNSVTIYYSIDGGEFTAVPCGVSFPDVTCTIPGAPSGSTVAYYVAARDTSGNLTTNTAASAPNLYTIGPANIPAGTYTFTSFADGSALGGDLHIDGTLGLDGALMTDGHKLVLDCGSNISTSGPGSYVAGEITRIFCTTETFTFPVGPEPVIVVNRPLDSPDGSPVTVNVTNVVAGSSLTVSTTGVMLPFLDPYNSVTRQWRLTKSGTLTADLTFKYNDTDVIGEEPAFKVFRYESGITTEVTPNAVEPLTNTATVSNVSNFSDWGIGLLYPTAADVSISGRVLTADGRGIVNAMVTLRNQAGEIRTVQTGSFGYYAFDGVASGQDYVISVISRRFRFEQPERLISVADDITGLDLTALP